MESDLLQEQKPQYRIRHEQQETQQNLNRNRQGQRFGGPGQGGPGDGTIPRQMGPVNRNQMAFGNPSRITEQRRDFDLMSEEEQNNYVQEVQNGMEWQFYHDRTNAQVEKPGKGEAVHPDDEFTLMSRLLQDVQERMEGRKEETKNFTRMKNGLARFLSPEEQDAGSFEETLSRLEADAQSYLNAHNWPFTFNRGVSKKKAMAKDILKAVRSMRKVMKSKYFSFDAKKVLQQKKTESAARRAEEERLRREEEERLRREEEARQQAEQERLRLERERQEAEERRLQEEQERQQKEAERQQVQKVYEQLRDINNGIRKILINFNSPNDPEAIKAVRDQVQALIKQRKPLTSEFNKFWREQKISEEMDERYGELRREADELFENFKFKYTKSGKEKVQKLKKEADDFRKLSTNPKTFGSMKCGKDAAEVLSRILQMPADYTTKTTTEEGAELSMQRIKEANEALEEMHRVGLKLEQLSRAQFDQLKNNPTTRPLALALLNDYRRRMNPPQKFDPKTEPAEFTGENFVMSLDKEKAKKPSLMSAPMITTVVTEEGQETHNFTVYPNPMGIQKKLLYQGNNNVSNYGGICASCSTVSISNFLLQDNGANENLVVETRKMLHLDEKMMDYYPERDEKGEIRIDPRTKQKIMSKRPRLSESGGCTMSEIPRLLLANNLNCHYLDKNIWGKGDAIVNAFAEELKKGNTILGSISNDILLEGEDKLNGLKRGESVNADHAIHICSACYEKDENGNEVLKGFLVKNSGVKSKKEGAKDEGTLDFIPVERMKLALVGTANHPVVGLGGIVVDKPKGEVI